MQLKWSDIPGLREAVKRENDVRDASFLDLTTSICGIEIRQMTPRDLLILDGIGNPLVANALPSPVQLAEFLWLLSPRYRNRSPVRRFLFARSIRRLNYIAAAKACSRYISDTFQDSPGGGGPASVPYASWCGHIVHTIATNYGWERNTTIKLPLKELFQYLRCIRRHHDPDCPMHNPSDKLKGDYARLLNARHSLVNVLKRRSN